jgi:hypothetical protein
VIGRDLAHEELEHLQEAGNRFVNDWTAHEMKLQGRFDIFEKKIIIVTVDEAAHQASGCSIDKLSGFMREIGREMNFEPLNRMIVAYREDGEVKAAPVSRLRELFKSGNLSAGTTIFNTAISNEKELRDWEIPFDQSWVMKKVPG